MKILIVDKSPELLRAATEVAMASGHSVVTAVTGKAALSIFEQARPDLVLLDTDLADMDPAGVMGILQVMAGDDWVPVMLLYPPASARKLSTWLQAGADVLLAKPLDRQQLQVQLGLIARITGLRQRLRTSSQELEDLRVELRSMDLRDGLTGVGNRRYFDVELNREWNRAFRAHEPLALLLIDIDGFQAYNDRHSVLAGDDCLMRVATALAGTLRRSGDVLARYGADEFGLLLPNTPADGAELIAQRLADAVTALGLPSGAGDSSVSVSIGLACARPGPTSGLADFLGATRDALALAKQAGVNRIHRA
jgi:diguanylate cyclase (GGDEF)-like protein